MIDPGQISARLAETPRPIDLVRAACLESAERIALLSFASPTATPRETTYRTLMQGTDAMLTRLRSVGIRSEDGIALALPPAAESVAAMIAATEAGVAFPLNPLLSEDALEAQLRLARVRCAIVHASPLYADARRRIEAAMRRLGLPDAVIAIDETHGRLETGGGSGRSDPERVAALFHTGGTTGEPKLAELSGRNMAAGALISAAAVGWHPGERIVAGLPLFHVGGALTVVLSALAVGATVIFPSLAGARDPAFVADAWRFVDRTAATALVLVPTSLSAVADVPVGPATLDALRVIVTGSSPLSPNLAQRLEQASGRPVAQVFGMTETAGICSAQAADGRFRPHAVGIPAPCMEIAVDAGPGETGEVRLRGPNVFLGYRTAKGRLPHAAGSWLSTGDLGRIGSDGQLHLTGRIKDVIIRGGHNIDPLSIEEVACRHPAVLQAAAVGSPDVYAGELPVLFVSLRPGASVTVEALAAHVAAGIAEPPARPRSVSILPELPLTAVGKVARFKLRQLAAIARVREALADFALADVVCRDIAAREIALVWVRAPTEEERAAARRLLDALGLRLVEDLADAGAV